MKSYKGMEAVKAAEKDGKSVVYKFADPTEGARMVSLDEARQIIREDPSLIVYPAPKGV